MEDSIENYIKLMNNTKGGRKKEPQKKLSDEELMILHKKKQCESNAVKVVEFLIEGQLRPEVFLRCLKHINPSYYQDVVEERAISKLCGYPLCGKHIPEMPKKRYFISMKTNKVYDVTDRKNYCSNLCYKASIHIKEQIDTNPLWLRKYEDNIKFTLLSSTDKGSPGEEIDQGVVKIPKDHEFTSISSFMEISLSDIGQMGVKNKKRNKQRKQNLETLDETEEIDDNINEAKTEIHTAKSSSSNNNSNIVDEAPTSSTRTSSINKAETRDFKSSKQNLSTKPNSKSKKKNTDSSFISVFANIKKYVHEWITLETYIFLYGEEKIREALNEKQLEEYFNKLKETENTLAKQKKYMEICQKLHLTQLAEDKFDNNVTGGKMKPIPDYSKLKEESKSMDLKIKSFYDGMPYELKEHENENNNIKKEKSQYNLEERPSAVLPLVETSSQTAIRRKIYLNSLEKAVVNLTQHLDVLPHYVMKDIQTLVKTFKLQAHNIVFKPAIWALIAFILIKMLSIRDDKLSNQLETKQSQMFIKVMLQRFVNAEDFMNELFEELKDVDLFLKQYFTDKSY